MYKYKSQAKQNQPKYKSLFIAHNICVGCLVRLTETLCGMT